MHGHETDPENAAGPNSLYDFLDQFAEVETDKGAVKMVQWTMPEGNILAYKGGGQCQVLVEKDGQRIFDMRWDVGFDDIAVLYESSSVRSDRPEDWHRMRTLLETHPDFTNDIDNQG